MILKVVNYENRDGKDGVWEVADYIDGITNASVTFDDILGLPMVKCTIENAVVISISVPNVAYLMNDNGKTIDRIEKVETDSANIFPALHDAIDEAVAKSME